MLQIPIGRSSLFKGVVDLLDMKAVIYDVGGDGKEFTELSLLDAGAAGEFEAAGVKQDALLAEAQQARDKLVEEIGELDDEVFSHPNPLEHRPRDPKFPSPIHGRRDSSLSHHCVDCVSSSNLFVVVLMLA